MKAQKKTDRRSMSTRSAVHRANGGRQSTRIEDDFGDETTDEFDATFARQLFSDGADLDDTNADMSDWCEAQQLARELSGRVRT